MRRRDCETKITDSRILGSLSEGAVERSETEGEKAIKIKFSLSLPQSFFFEKRQLPRQREPLSDNRNGCPYGHIYFQV